MKGLLFAILFISSVAGVTKNVLFYDQNDVIYFTSYTTLISGCTPEAKSNERETTCTNGPTVPPDFKNMNRRSNYYGVTNCFYVAPGNSDGNWYRDSYCGLNPLDGTYFFNRCYYDPGTWMLETYSDANCTQLIKSEIIAMQGSCTSNHTDNSSMSFFCGQNSWKPTTTSTTTTRSLLLVTQPPNAASKTSISWILLGLFLFAIG